MLYDRSVQTDLCLLSNKTSCVNLYCCNLSSVAVYLCRLIIHIELVIFTFSFMPHKIDEANYRTFLPPSVSKKNDGRVMHIYHHKGFFSINPLSHSYQPPGETAEVTHYAFVQVIKAAV